jgi:hypothetical protein
MPQRLDGKPKHNGPYPRPLADRFNEKWRLNRKTGCWLWRGAHHVFGYGTIGVGSVKDGSKNVRGAHMVSWELHRGPIPKGKHVLHRCDVPACVNPSHLFLGSHADNLKDASIKGRMARKLTAEDIREIRRRRGNGEKIVPLGKEFGITHAMVSHIYLRRTWRYV